MANTNYTSKLEIPVRIFNSLEKKAKERNQDVDDLANKILNKYFNDQKKSRKRK